MNAKLPGRSGELVGVRQTSHAGNSWATSEPDKRDQEQRGGERGVLLLRGG